MPIHPSGSTPVLLSYLRLGEGHLTSIPRIVANPSITRSTGWKYGIPAHRDSLAVHRDQQNVSKIHPHLGLGDDKLPPFAAEDQELLRILGEVISDAEAWAESSPASIGAAEVTPCPFHEKIRQTYGHDELYQKHLPAIGEVERSAGQRALTRTLDVSKVGTTQRRE